MQVIMDIVCGDIGVTTQTYSEAQTYDCSIPWKLEKWLAECSNVEVSMLKWITLTRVAEAWRARLRDLDGNYTLIATKPHGFTLSWKQTMHKVSTGIPHQRPELKKPTALHHHTQICFHCSSLCHTGMCGQWKKKIHSKKLLPFFFLSINIRETIICVTASDFTLLHSDLSDL